MIFRLCLRRWMNCLDYNMTILEVPWRSPFAVVEAIKDIIKDKVVCDLESACGDIMVAMKKHAKDVNGMEINPDMVLASKSRGLNTIEGNVFTSPIPDAEVYYIWCDAAVIHLIPGIMKKGTWIIASDPREEEDTEIEKLNLDGYWIEVPYNEGNLWRQQGTYRLFVTEKT